MSKSMDYEAHLKQLREQYYRSYPKQRVHIAKQRIDNPSHGPNLLVTYVSSLEGLLRSLVIWYETTSDRPSEETYKKYRFKGLTSLYKTYLKQKSCSCLIGEENYKLIEFAIEYRNLLAHECTYLGQDKYPELIQVCEKLFKSICNHENIEYS